MAYIRSCRPPARMGRPILVPGGMACAAAVRRFPTSFTPLRALKTLPSLVTAGAQGANGAPAALTGSAAAADLAL